VERGIRFMATIDWSGDLVVDESGDYVTVKVPVSGATTRWVRTFKTVPRASAFRINVVDEGGAADRVVVEVRVPSDCSPESLHDTLDGLIQLVGQANEAEAHQASASAGLESAARDWWRRQR
jgi:hypothetical protein